MERIVTTPRKNYVKKLESISFNYHSKYWNESAYYRFSTGEIDEIQSATNELYKMCLTAVQHVIDNDLFDKLHIDRDLIPLILRSWENDEPSIYGRFDLAYDGITSPKMLEFNGDTPGTLYESSIVQQKWLEDVSAKSKQFNIIHENLLIYFNHLLEYLNGEKLHFTSVDSDEDVTMVKYLMDIATKVGIATEYIGVEDIGWDENNNEFVDLNDETILNVFKLYPWEWLIQEKFGMSIVTDNAESKWIEPAWKVILSSKGILAILWELFPNHQYLLPTFFDDPNGMRSYVKKPIFSREGSNVTIFRNGVQSTSVEGEYGEEGYVYQKLYELPNYDENYPIIGSWVIGEESSGIGIRENNSEITDKNSRFVPHLIKQ